MSKPAESTRLPWGTRIAYGLGDFYGGASVTIISLLFLWFLTDTVGLQPLVAGGVLFAGRIADGLVDPALGILTDRTKSRWGRRAPWFLFLSLPAALVYGILWSPAPFSSEGSRAVWYGAVYILSVIVFSSVMTPYAALAPELTPDYDERTRLVAVRMTFSILSGLVAAVVPKLVVDAFERSGSRAAGFSIMGWGAGALFGVLWLFLFFFFKGKGLGSPPEKKAGIRESFRGAFSNRSFRLLVLIYLFSFLGTDLLSAAFVYYLNHWLRAPSLYTPVMAVLLLSAAASLPIHAAVSRRFGKRTGYLAGACAWLAGLGGLASLERGAPEALILVLSAFVGIGMGTAYAYPWSMLPETVDVEEAASGRRQEGLYAGVMTFLRQTSSSLAVLGLGAVLQFSGYVSGAATQPESAARAVRIAVAAGPGLLLAAGLAAGAAFPVTRENFRIIAAALAARRRNAANLPGEGRVGLDGDPSPEEVARALAVCYGSVSGTAPDRG